MGGPNSRFLRDDAERRQISRQYGRMLTHLNIVIKQLPEGIRQNAAAVSAQSCTYGASTFLKALTAVGIHTNDAEEGKLLLAQAVENLPAPTKSRYNSGHFSRAERQCVIGKLNELMSTYLQQKVEAGEAGTGTRRAIGTLRRTAYREIAQAAAVGEATINNAFNSAHLCGCSKEIYAAIITYFGADPEAIFAQAALDAGQNTAPPRIPHSRGNFMRE